MIFKSLFSLFLCTCIILPCKPSQTMWDGQKYDKHSSLQYTIGLEAVESFNLQGNEKVLDIGCGNGKITEVCAKKLISGSLTALDISPSMIEFAHANHGVKNVQFLVQDVATMSFNQEFDFAYSLFCLHWLNNRKEQELAIKNIAQSLKPSGHAVLYMSLPSEFSTLFEEVFHTLLSTPEWRHYQDILTYNSCLVEQEFWIESALKSNMRVEDFKTPHYTMVYENCQHFKSRFIAYGIGAKIMQVMGEQDGDKFVDSYLAKLFKKLGLTLDQPLTWHSHVLILRVSKL